MRALKIYDPQSRAVLYPRPLKHNRVVASLSRSYLELRTTKLEKVIFSATTGRSGTTSLVRILSAIPQCHAIHEAYPIMNAEWLQAASHGEAEEVRRYYERVKAIYIRRAAIGMRYYAEMSHLFLKTFIEPAARDFGERLEVIHLVRPALEVASSIHYHRQWPGTEKGNEWWLDYRAPGNLIQLAEQFDGQGEFSHPFYRALWYWYEMEARVKYWKQRLPQVRFHYFETRWLNDQSRVTALLDSLGLEYDMQRLSGVVGVKANTKESRTKGEALEEGAARTMQERFEELIHWDSRSRA